MTADCETVRQWQDYGEHIQLREAEVANYCGNRLYVIGPESEVSRFVADAKGVYDSGEQEGEELLLSFDSQVPTPDRQQVRAEGFDDEVRWRNANWGTKWIDGSTTRFERSGSETAYYEFTTAYSPPRPWLREVAFQYPELQFCLSYVQEDSDSLMRTLWVRVNDAPEGMVDFSEGYLLFEKEGERRDWEAARKQIEELDPRQLVESYDPDELVQVFQAWEFEDLDDDDAVELLKEHLQSLPEDLEKIKDALAGARQLTLTHPKLGSVSSWLIDSNSKAFPERTQAQLDENDVAGSLHNDPKVGQAVSRLAFSGVLDKAGLFSEMTPDEIIDSSEAKAPGPDGI